MGLAAAEKGLLWLDIEARAAGGHASRALRGRDSGHAAGRPCSDALMP